MKLLRTYLMVLLILPFSLSGQILDYELGVLDLGVEPAFEKTMREVMVSNGKAYIITSNNGFFDLLEYDVDTVSVLIKDTDQSEGLGFIGKLDDGILFTRGSFSSTLYLYFLNTITDEMIEVYEFEHNLKDINIVNGKAIFVDTNDRLLVSDGTLSGTFLLREFTEIPNSEGVELATETLCFLRADDQLWQTDGTLAGTMHVENLNYSPFDVLETGDDYIYFTKRLFSPFRNELWRSDGTNPAELITDIGVTFTNITKIIPTDDGVYFTGETDEYGREFWKCDLGSTQSELVIDILPGVESGVNDNSIDAFEIVTEDQITFFRGGGVNEGQIWKTDGTALGTTMVIDFTGLPEYEDFDIYDNSIVRSEDNKDYILIANDDQEGRLWSYEHTSESLTFLTNLSQASFSELRMSGSKVYFTAFDSGDQLWVTDGTVNGTINLENFPNSAQFEMLGAHDEQLYYNQKTFDLGLEVYITDGSVGSGSLLKDIHPTLQYSSYPAHFFLYNNEPHFYAEDDVSGQSIYKTDGTTDGTTLAVDLYPHTSGSDIEFLKASGGKLYFSIEDTLWVSDGTVASSVKLDVPFENFDIYWGETNTHLFFTYQRDLYVTDGTVEGTEYLLEGGNNSGSDFTSFQSSKPVLFNNVLYFFYKTPTDGIELYSSDGTPGGTQMVFESMPFEESIFDMSSANPLLLGDRFFFANEDAANGNELWSSDGTLAGTTIFQDLEPGTSSSNPRNPTVFKDKIFFQGFSQSAGNINQAWVTDGTPAGTLLLGNTSFDAGEKNASIGEDLFYLSNDDLWKTNGTPEGTILIMENTSTPYDLTSYGNKIVFGLENDANDIEPWISDGTPAGTYILKDVDPSDDSDPTNFTVIQNLMFFTADTVNYGNNTLWQSEGTEETTRRTPFERQELNSLEYFTKLEDRLYFVAEGEVFRKEIYYLEFNIPTETIKGEVFKDTNGNGIKDPDEVGFNNAKILAESDQKYFTYTDTTGAYEIYLPEGSYELTTTLPPCSEITTDSSSYQVEITDVLLTGFDFGLTTLPDSQSLNIHLVSATTRCGFTIPFWVNVGNNGCDTAATKIFVELDSLVTFVEADIPPETIDGQILSWTINTLEIGEQEQIKMMLTMPDETHVDDTISMMVESFLWDSDTLALNDTYDYRSIIRCAIDPNDKQVSPDRSTLSDDNYTLIDEKLTFQVRFQNTGNDTAFTVRIIDTLSNFLDLETFQPLAASHPYRVSLSPEGVLDFVFENILLPDSTTNEAESHGFILFEIYPKEDISEFAEINNTAYIYFDFNSAIVTNTTGSTMVSSFDMDNDGVDIWSDCNDNNPEEGGGVEIPYNGIDEDCNPLTPDDDLDNDGFVFEDDCDDTNAAINDDAIEIPNNGIDEDCDGEDLMVGLDDLSKLNIKIQPNPTSGIFEIILPAAVNAEIELRNYDGKTLLKTSLYQQGDIDVSTFPSGMYLLFIKTNNNIWVERIIKID